MKIFVTGSNGQVGKEFQNLGNTSDHQVICMDRHQLDVTDAAKLSHTFLADKPNIVINCAAYTAVDTAERESEIAFAINADAVGNIADVCHQQQIPLIQISTDYVFTGDSLRPYKETDQTGPTGVYGRSKLAGEHAIVERLEQHIILRTAWVFGSHGNNFVKTMLRLAAEREELRVISDQVGSPTSAKSIADCCMLIANFIEQRNHHDIPWGTYHFTGAPYTSWFGFAQQIFDSAIELGMLDKAPKLSPISSSQFSSVAKRPQNSRLDCEKLTRTFNIEPDNWHLSLRKVLKSLY